MAFLIAGLLATFCLALFRAMTDRPNMVDAYPRRLNTMLISVMGWTALVLNGVYATYLFGMIQPLIAAIALYAAYRLALGLDLLPFYRYAVSIGVITLITTLLVLAQHQR